LDFLFPCFMVALITGMSILALKHIAPKIGLLDSPGGRKRHQGQVPLVGGLAILIGFLFTCLTVSWPLSPYKPFFACTILIVFLGIADDLHELSPRLRLAGQAFIVLLAVFWGGNALHDLGDLFFMGNIHLGHLSLLFTLAAWLSFINASNMLDGTDGLAGSINLLQLGWLCVIAFLNGANSDGFILLLFITAIVVFLLFNFPYSFRKNMRIIPTVFRAATRRDEAQQSCSPKDEGYKIFLGDAGSLLLGFIVAWFAIRFSQQGGHFPSPVVFLWITAVPLLDFFAVTIRRIRRSQSPLQGGRDHIHHILAERGFSSLKIVLTMAMVSLILASIGLVLWVIHCPDGFSFLLLIALLIFYVQQLSKQETKNAPITSHHPPGIE